MKRRTFLLGGAASAVLFATLGPRRLMLGGQARAESFEVTRTDDQWRATLTPAQFAVLRQEDTESPWTSQLLKEHRKGIFHCAGCDLAAYSSEAKYDSGTGWPSFWEALPDAIGTKTDTSLLMTRTEVHCRRCGGPFGHIFDDGPQPTGKRHCINGLALTFKPATA
jgi:peptide-methionine (R)-S-oxide reductase